jgi:chemosensory pili system protein ChpA (sensor histidine kinase/response regulator)
MSSPDSHTTDASQWVVDQIQVELDDALAKLERYIEHSEETEQLQECAEALKNTENVCLMTGMDAQAVLSAELYNLSSQHLEQPEKNTEQILGILSEGVLTLRASLGTAGGDAIFIKLTPRVNNIRALTEQPLASESDLFQPDIISGLQSFSRTFRATLDSAVLRKIRTLYQRSALILMRDGLPDTTLNDLQKVFKLLYQRGGTAYLSAIAFTCLALLEKISAGDLEFELALRQQFKRVDEVLKKLIAGGDHEDLGLLKNLLFYLAISGGDQAAGTRTLKFFKLEKFAQSALEINAGSLNQVDATLLEPVVDALSADIAQAKTALEDALTGQLDFGETKRLLNILITRMGDTLAMVGIEDAQTTAAEVSNAVRSWKSIDTIEKISDEDLSLVADALVRLEVRLKSLTSSHSSDSIENIDSASEVGDARQMLLDQGRMSVERSKADINDYMSRDFDSHALEKVPVYLTELEGALRFYPLDRLANIAISVRKYIQHELLEKRVAPEPEPIDLLADVIVSIDYYLECLEQDASFNLAFLIDKAEENCATIGYPAEAPDFESPIAASTDISEDEQEAIAVDIESEAPVESAPEAVAEVEVEVEVEVEPESDAALEPEAEAETDTSDDDDEITSIFIEELEEVVPQAIGYLQKWSDSNDENALEDLRRAFHTLKGGARMIGASTIGELSWALEDLLNQVASGLLSADPEIYEVSGAALQSYPALVEQLKAGQGENELEDIAELRNKADLLSRPKATKEEVSELPDNDSLTSIYAEEARKHRAAIVQEIVQEISTSKDEGASGLPTDALVRAFQVLIEGAYTSELPVLAEDLEPLLKLCRHYILLNEPMPDSFTSILGLWAKAFDETLDQLSKTGLYKPDILDSTSEQSRALLKSEEARTADDFAHNRERRFQPLHRVMAEELNNLISADQTLLNWKNGNLSQGDIAGVLEDLNTLNEISTLCIVDELSLYSAALSDAINNNADQETIDSETYDSLQESYDLLLAMLDSVASWQVIATPSQENLQNLAALAGLELGATEVEPTETPIEDVDETFGSGADSLEPIDSLEAIDSPEPTESNELEETSAEVEVEAETESASEAVATKEKSSPYVDDDFQDELMETFLEEAEDLLNDISATLTSWRTEPDDFSHADSLHRALHTLKGGARLSGMEALGSAAHDFESYSLDHQVARNANPEFFDQSMARYDSLMEMVEQARSGELIEEPTEADAPSDTVEPESVTITPIVEPPAPAPKEADVFDEALASGSESEASASTAPISSLEGAFKVQEQEKSDTTEPLRETADNRVEMVRLRAPDLDEIINLSGESTVFRTRVEAEVTSLNNTIGELENTIDRIQMLARRLDVETQAQIVFRKEQIAESEFPKDFDPLEMDRYSMLQQLSRQLNESASDLRDLRGTLSSNNSDTLTLLTQTSRLQSELNDRLIRTRMVPFGRLMPRLQRMTRQIATELEKKVQLHTGVLEGELDRNVLDQILPALEHVLRNAIDHGIETTEERLELNKDPAGRIGLEVQRDGAQVVIKIADDGRGINLEKVKQRALDNGLIDANQAATMQDAEIADLIFMPGFSTAESLTEISGRGVGMDIVRSIVSQLGGTVEVGSKSGVGSTFFLRIPFTLSVNRALMISIEDNNYALPLSSLEALARVPREELDSYYEEDDKYLSYGNHKYRVMYLGEILKTATRPPTDSLTDRTVPLALFRSGEYSVAAQVDEIYGSQEIVVKSLGHPFSNIPGVSGAAIMGDGTVLVTLDMFTLMSKTDHSSLGGQPQIENRELVEEEKTEILVVDDSVTVRKVTSRFLKREGFAVTLARDGVEALQMINEHIPDLIILDVEMPNMDGFELISILRSNERFEDIPVILITSRTGEKHRQRGLELGAQRYFGKPYREDEIMLAIGELTGSQGSKN